MPRRRRSNSSVLTEEERAELERVVVEPINIRDERRPGALGILSKRPLRGRGVVPINDSKALWRGAGSGILPTLVLAALRRGRRRCLDRASLATTPGNLDSDRLNVWNARA